jgi:hypothetical protein
VRCEATPVVRFDFLLTYVLAVLSPFQLLMFRYTCFVNKMNITRIVESGWPANKVCIVFWMN